MSAVVFLAMWVTMMAAMMFPTIAPIVLLHRMVVRRRGEGTAPTVAFVSGYLGLWASVGVLPLAALVAFRQFAHGSGGSIGPAVPCSCLPGPTSSPVGRKRACAPAAAPLTFLLTHDFGRGRAGALRAGLSHGLYCLGCCWALMAVLFVVGLMNLTWMAAVAVVFVAEKNWRHGVGLTKLVGTAVLCFGIAVLVHPSLLGSVAPLQHTTSPMVGG